LRTERLASIRSYISGWVKRRVVALVVAAAAVADHVDDDVLLERLAELERQPRHPHARLGVVAVHVEDRRLDRLGDVGAVPTSARLPARW
jgi:hypothetical protein